MLADGFSTANTSTYNTSSDFGVIIESSISQQVQSSQFFQLHQCRYADYCQKYNPQWPSKKKRAILHAMDQDRENFLNTI